jgi:hypothetical protein
MQIEDAPKNNLGASSSVYIQPILFDYFFKNIQVKRVIL